MIPILIACLFVVAVNILVSFLIFKKNLISVKSTALFVATTLLGLGLGPLSYNIAHSVAQQSAVGGYHQFLHGSIVSKETVPYRCSLDSACTHSYACDFYSVTVVDSYAYTDNQGRYHGQTSHTETRSHDCPYATMEYSYTVTDNFGNEYTYGSHWFAANPQPWSRSEVVPDVVPRGIPRDWQHAVDALNSGNSDPVTVPDTYDNFILSSEKTILRASSDKIDVLRKLNLLPVHTVNLKQPIRNYYRVDEVSFVGFTPPDTTSWQDSLMHLNAALGVIRQGDMHIVAIKASAIPASVSPEDYLNALKAYWLNGLGKYALAKNGIALVVAVDDSGKTIKWSKAATGMPIGNGAMLQALGTQLTGSAFTPDTVLGSTKAPSVAMVKNSKGKLKPKTTYQVGSGRVAQIVMQDFPFQRACMSCTNKGEAASQGFVDLASEISLSTAAAVWTSIIDGVLITGVWWLLYIFVINTTWRTQNISRYTTARLYRESIPNSLRKVRHDR